MSYKTDHIPLWKFFQDLRRSGAQLGIDNYELLIHALLKGASVSSQEDLFRLCKTVWYKPDQSFFVFQELFNKYFSNPKPEVPAPDTPTETPLDNTGNEGLNDPITGSTDEPASSTLPEDRPSQQEKKQAENIREVYVSVGQGASGNQDTSLEELTDKGHKFHFMPYFLSMKEREIEQRFNFIREQERRGFTEEVDIEASVEVITKHGFLSEIQYLPNFTNRAALTTFIDYDGSMVAFHDLAEKLIQIIRDQVKIDNETFYFYNLPHDDLLFKDVNHTDSIQMEDWIKQMKGKKARQKGLLIISDAGAARGRLSPERIEATEELLKKLLAVTQKIAWLNPVPRKRWQATSAELIAQKVHMIELSPTGINYAVNVLRGMLS